MTSAIDPNFITTDPVSKSGMRLQLQRAADEISALQTAVDAKLALAGGTLTGDLIISKSNPIFSLRKSAAGQANQLGGYTSSALRWLINLGNSTAESGSNAGSDFQLGRYTDAGALIAQALTITRSTGVAAFEQIPTAPTATAADNSTKLATTAFVRGEFTGSNQSLGFNGFQKFPGGFQIKQGVGIISGGTCAITFGTAFPTAMSNCVVCARGNAGVTGTAGVRVDPATFATTGFTVYSDGADCLFSYIATGY